MAFLFQLYGFLSLASFVLIILLLLSQVFAIGFAQNSEFRRASGYVFAATAALSLVFGNIIGALIWGLNAYMTLRTLNG